MEFRAVFKETDSVDYAKGIFEQGIQGIEVLYSEPYLEQAKFLRFEQMVQQIIAETGCSLSVHAPQIDVNLSSPNRYLLDLSRQALLRSAKWAQDLGADLLVIHPGLGVPGMSQGSWHHGYPSPPGWEGHKLDLVAEGITLCAREFPGLRLAVENLIFPHEFFRKPDDLALLIKTINLPNVGVCFDVGHGVAAGQDWQDFLTILGRHIFHVHTHDNHGAIDEHLPLGEGTIPYREVFTQLKAMGYGGAVTLEFRIKDWPLLCQKVGLV